MLQAASAVIKDVISTTLEEYKVGIITKLAVKNVTLGGVCPTITGGGTSFHSLFQFF